VFDAGYLRSGCLLSRIVGRGLDLEWVSSNKSSSQDMIYFLLTFSPSKTTKVKKWNLQGLSRCPIQNLLPVKVQREIHS
jgi:hypothetical protein